MKRLQLIEIEDQPWLPASIRDALTDYLQFVIALGRPYAPILPRLEAALRQARTSGVVDLCSGAGGPWPTMRPLVEQPLDIELTDRYPNAGAIRQLNAASDKGLTYRPSPVDAAAVPSELGGFRTLFSSFHHFNPDQARGLLRNAVENQRGIGIFEATQRSAPAVLSMFVASLLVLLITPFIRPFRLSRLLWTYVVPVVAPLILFDGIVSCLRTYTPAELQTLVDGLPPAASRYHWEIGEEQGKRGTLPVTYLIGYPSDASVP